MNFEKITKTESALHADEAGRFVSTHSLSIYSGWTEIICGCCGHVHDIPEAKISIVANRDTYRCRSCGSVRGLEFDRFLGWEANHELN